MRLFYESMNAKRRRTTALSFSIKGYSELSNVFRRLKHQRIVEQTVVNYFNIAISKISHNTTLKANTYKEYSFLLQTTFSIQVSNLSICSLWTSLTKYKQSLCLNVSLTFCKSSCLRNIFLFNVCWLLFWVFLFSDNLFLYILFFLLLWLHSSQAVDNWHAVKCVLLVKFRH